MASKIRKATPNDLEGIYNLYDGRKSYDELKWLYNHPCEKDEMSCFVAVDNDEVVGVVGYVISTYSFADKLYSGLSHISWMVSEKARGMVGVQLLMNALKKGDFAFVVGGSEMAQNVLTGYKYKELFKTNTYVKIYSPCKFLRILPGNIIKRLLKVTYQYRPFNAPKLKKKGSNVLLKKISEPKVLSDQKQVSILQNTPSNEHLNWLNTCPEVDAHMFMLQHEGKELGHVLLYTSINQKHKTGGIIHVPYLGEDISMWSAVMFEIEQYLLACGCISIAALASAKPFNDILKLHGFKSSIYQKPYYIRDLKGNLKDIPSESMHISFSEADKGYRSVYYNNSKDDN